ncbi:uncharacterized protein GBIM_14586 [Gryllus bimaculatus]|nr:uncharacterized protein GBIM_14586 [Gryllus bimaculatus]
MPKFPPLWNFIHRHTSFISKQLNDYCGVDIGNVGRTGSPEQTRGRRGGGVEVVVLNVVNHFFECLSLKLGVVDMASLSLPRVLQQRKTSLELERENFEKFQEKGGATFWACALRLPLQEHRIVAWKFCHVLHKVLREGHPHVVTHSQRHRSTIEDLGKLWCHLREGYGKLIQLYCQLLITKLDFHRRNPRFPGNLQVSREELESIGENDINTYFEMSVEMFDYMDEILNLQTAIFGSLDMSRSNSMMSSGQCRLAPLIPCIQDSSQLYDYCVKILFKLHASLPPDTLAGHRERFLKQFRELRQFYLTASTLQYFKTLIHIPPLPENPPNFLVQAELRSYVPPVVVLPPEETTPSEHDSADGNLIDTSDTGSTGDLVDLNHHNGSVSPDIVAERDNLLQAVSRLKMDYQQRFQDYQHQVQTLRETIVELETDLAKKDSELLQERQLKDDLLQQTEEMSKYHETEKKAKTIEEKFQKLKDVYTKLREEHIQLIRQKAALEKELRLCDKMTTFAKAANNLIVSIVRNIIILCPYSFQHKKADVDKQLISAKTASETAARSRAEAEAKLQEMAYEKQRTEVMLQQSSVDTEAELSTLRQAKEEAKNENQVLTSKVDWVLNEKSILEGELQDLLAQKEDLDVRLQEMDQQFNIMEAQLRAQAQEYLQRLLVACVTQAEAIVQKSVHEVDNPALSAVVCTPDYFQSLTEPVLKSLESFNTSFSSLAENDNEIERIEEVLKNIIIVAHLLANFLIQGKTTSNTSPDIEFGDRLSESCKKVGTEALTLLECVRDSTRKQEVTSRILTVRNQVNEVSEMVSKLTSQLKGNSAEMIEDMLEDELSRMDKAIEEAAKRIEEMLSKSRAADSGLKLEVNEKILDSCTNLMQAIRILVQKSRLLQAEIVGQGKGTASAKEFYKRNHQWTEGLISAAKAVGVGAKFLLTAADKVVSGQGKFEQLVVASQEIAASTAQLVVASRVKADRHSKNLGELGAASKGVTQATGQVVATAKDCSQMVEENEDLDVSGLSLHQAKRLEMESQVRVLELEQALQQERLRLAALRKQHYQLAGEVEGWDAEVYSEIDGNSAECLASHYPASNKMIPNELARCVV